MKTLKKVLSVALVLAMALSLVTITSAAGVSKYQDFTDAADIVNKEAVDTLAALGIIAGMPDGSFDPKGNVTRAQAAKIIAYMLLGATSADSLKVTVAPFKDVPATHWAAAYIQYCVTRGIINGLGDGTFNPDGQVTAAQFAKMLLTAIGYGKLGEYVGENWALNAIVDAQNLEILDTNVDYMAPATRDEIARYAFNAYVGDKCYFVTLDKTLDGYVAVDSGANKGTLAAQQKVEASESIKIINGQASRKWTKDGVNLTGNYFAVEDQRVLATGAYDAFFSTISGYARETNPYKLRFDADLQFYLDGENKTPTDILNGSAIWANVTAPPDYVGFTAWDALTTHKGIAYAESFCKLGSVYTLVDSDKDGEVDVISVYSRNAAKLTSDVVVTAAGLITLPGTGISNKTKDQIVGYEGLKKGDVVVFYYDEEADCYYVEKTRAVSGAVTSATVGGPEVTAITLGGTDYNVYPSAAVRDSKSATNYFFMTSANINRVFTGYVDSNNFVVYLEPADDASSLPYGIVLTYGANPGALGSAGYSIRILKEDGTIAVYQQAPDAGGQYTAVFDTGDDKVTTTTDIIDPFALVTYRFTDDGKIIVTEVTGFTEATLASDYAKGSNKVEVQYASNTQTKYIAKSTKVFYANSIAYTNPNDYGVVTGFANTKAVNVPTSPKTQTVYFYASPENPDVANVLVFITTPVGTGRAQYAFANPLFGFAWSKTVVVNGKEYKQATFFKDGNPMFTLTAPANLINDGDDTNGVEPVAAFGTGVVEYQLDSEGYVTSLTTESDNIDNFTTPQKVTYVDPSGEYFVTENGAVMTDENTVFYRFDRDTFSYTQEPLIASIDEVITYEVLGVVYNNSTDKVATQVYFQVTVK